MKHKMYGMMYCLFLCITMLLPSMPVYADARSVMAYIPVVCVGENTDEEFVYTLESASKEHQNVDATELRLSDGKKGSFDVTYTYPETYRYKISQKAGSDADTTYDSTVYDAVVYVTEDSTGNLAAEVIAYKDGSDEKVDAMVFNNHHVKSSGTSSSVDTSANVIKSVSTVATSTNQSAPNVQTSDIGTLPVYIGGIILSALAVMLILSKKRRVRDEK